jgi:hypothetical protein
MREDDDELGHYVRLWSRIVTLCAVIIAVPVILWTITAFVRNQPKLSTFHYLLTTASINTPGHTTIGEPTQQQSTPRQAKLADPQEGGAPERAAPEEPLVVDHPPDASQSAPSVAQMADTSSASSATPMVAEGAHGMQPPLTINDGAAAGRTNDEAPMQPAPATEGEADAFSGSAPLPGPIRLPRPRPHDAGTVRTADPTLSRVPMPTPARGRWLWRAAGHADQQPIRSTAAAIAEARRQGTEISPCRRATSENDGVSCNSSTTRA